MKSIEGSMTLNVSASTAFDAWLSSDIHTAMTGGTAIIDPIVGGTFSIWDGYAEGTTTEINLKTYKIVQSWRENSEDWPADHMSTLTIQCSPIDENHCTLRYSHMGVPQNRQADIEQGWHDYYWLPMQDYFAAK